MLIGNKSRIAFEFLEIQEEHAVVNMYLANTNITPTDNSHYYSIIVSGIKQDIDILHSQDLTLKDEYKNLELDELFNLAEEEVQIHHENCEMNCFYYDLSTQDGSFYVYQHIDDLVFFGKLFKTDEILSCSIYKFSYLILLQKLLIQIIQENPNHPMHKFQQNLPYVE